MGTFLIVSARSINFLLSQSCGSGGGGGGGGGGITDLRNMIYIELSALNTLG